MRKIFSYRGALSLQVGMFLLIPLAFIYGFLEPALALTSWGFESFFIIGCAAYCVGLLLYTSSMKSLAIIGQLYAPRVALGKRLPGAIIGVCLTCCMWGVNTGFFTKIVEHISARERTEVSGEFVGFGHDKGCTKRARIVTKYGNIEACVFGHVSGFHSSTPMPDELVVGENVALVGRKNREMFVLVEIQREANASARNFDRN